MNCLFSPVIHIKLDLRKIILRQKSISFLGPSIWNKLSKDIKVLNAPTSITYNYKKLVLMKKLE